MPFVTCVISLRVKAVTVHEFIPARKTGIGLLRCRSSNAKDSLMTSLPSWRLLLPASRDRVGTVAVPVLMCWLAGFVGAGHGQSAAGAVIWNWSYAGTEAGTFTTDGTLADAAGSYNFTVNDFSVTSSTIASLVGRPYSETQPVQGFLWDGAAATQFYRQSGAYTNGSSFYVTPPDSSGTIYTFGFYADGTGAVGQLVEGPFTPVVSPSALTLTPTAVPEPGTLAMLVAGLFCGGSAFSRRRSARRHWKDGVATPARR